MRSAIIAGLLLTVIVLPFTVQAAEELKVITLDESIREALNNNWSIKAKKENINKSVYVKDQAKASFLPKFSTSYGYTRLSEITKSDPVNIGAITIPGRELNNQDNYQWKGSITQPIFTGFALSSSYELAKLGINLAELELDLDKLDLGLRVKQAYYDILKADRAVDVAQKAVASLDSHVQVARNFYKVGMIPINDLLKAEVELANSQYNLVKAQNALLLARSAFNIVLSRDIDKPLEVEDILNYKPESGDFETYLNHALKNRPDIKAIDTSLLQMDQEVRLAESKFYPEISLVYDYIKEGEDPDVSGGPFHEANRWQSMAVLSWTFWEWGKTRSAVREKESLKGQIIQNRSALLDQIRLEIKQAVLALSVAEKNIPTTEKAVEQAEENLRVSEERYKAQVTTSTEVLDAQTLLTQARTNFYNALYEHNLAKAKLHRAMGEY